MKLIRMIHNGEVKSGLWKEGLIVDLKTIYPSIPDICETFFTEGWLRKLFSVNDPGIELNAWLTSPICLPAVQNHLPGKKLR